MSHGTDLRGSKGMFRDPVLCSYSEENAGEDPQVGSPPVDTVAKAATALQTPLTMLQPSLTKLVVVVPLPLQSGVVAEQVVMQEEVVAAAGIAQITMQSVTTLLTLQSCSVELGVGTRLLPMVMVGQPGKGGGVGGG